MEAYAASLILESPLTCQNFILVCAHLKRSKVPLGPHGAGQEACVFCGLIHAAAECNHFADLRENYMRYGMTKEELVEFFRVAFVETPALDLI